jgi:flavin reductase ActVB
MSAAPSGLFESLSATDGDAYRRIARCLAASVTVVTVRRRPETVTPDAPRLDGFTATSFVTISMTPPIVLVSATNASSALAMLRDADCFAVNLLSAGQRAVADLFASPHDHRGEPFDVHNWTPDHHGAPLFEGALGAFSARVRELHPAGDHTLCLGDVTSLHLGAPGETLIYHNRRYGGFDPGT